MKTDFDDPGALIDEWREWYSGWNNQVNPDDDVIMRIEAHFQNHDLTQEQQTELLVRWYRWWIECDAAPAKLPDVLHLRTAMNLYRAGKLKARTLELID